MAKRPPERLAAALKANLRRRKAQTAQAAAPEAPADRPKDPQGVKDKAKIPAPPKG